MKTIKLYLPVFLILLFTGIGIVGAQPEKNLDEHLNTILRADEEQNVNDMPFNTANFASEAMFQKLVKNYFSKNDEKRIPDIPLKTLKNTSQQLSPKIMKSIFEEKDEAYINDIPPVILKAMKNFQLKLLANSTCK